MRFDVVLILLLMRDVRFAFVMAVGSEATPEAVLVAHTGRSRGTRCWWRPEAATTLLVAATRRGIGESDPGDPNRGHFLCWCSDVF